MSILAAIVLAVCIVIVHTQKSQQVAFTLSWPTGTNENSERWFRIVQLNIGGGYTKGYSHHTGKFTVPLAGIYALSVTLLSSSKRTHPVYCDIMKNSDSVARAFSKEGMFDSASVFVHVHLSVGDIIGLECDPWKWVKNNYFGSSFTGGLITPD